MYWRNNLSKSTKIFETLKEYYLVAETVAKEKDYMIAGVALYGSQNYNLDTEKSDIDAIALVIPNIHNFVFCSIATDDLPHKISMTNDNDNTIVFMDIRKFVSGLLKGELRSLEILNTPYFYGEENFKIFKNRLQLFTDDFIKLNIRHIYSNIGTIAYQNSKRIAEKGEKRKKLTTLVYHYYLLAKKLEDINYSFDEKLWTTEEEKEDIRKVLNLDNFSLQATLNNMIDEIIILKNKERQSYETESKIQLEQLLIKMIMELLSYYK